LTENPSILLITRILISPVTIPRNPLARNPVVYNNGKPDIVGALNADRICETRRSGRTLQSRRGWVASHLLRISQAISGDVITYFVLKFGVNEIS
jgi:hypothetical protein